MTILSIIIILLILGASSVFSIIYICNSIIIKNSKGKLFNSITDIPYNRVGVLLGTTKYLHFGPVNLYYQYRIEAALLLLKSSKIKYIIVSGDNHKNNFNEPEQMKADLLREGVEEDKIFLDYAGYRTLNSMLRVKNAFGEKNITVISQQFHNERATYIAKRLGMDVIAFNAKDPFPNFSNHVKIRETLARVKVFLDFLTHAHSRIVSRKITIPE